jgi:hypothetical protein
MPGRLRLRDSSIIARDKEVAREGARCTRLRLWAATYRMIKTPKNASARPTVTRSLHRRRFPSKATYRNGVAEFSRREPPDGLAQVIPKLWTSAY